VDSLRWPFVALYSQRVDDRPLWQQVADFLRSAGTTSEPLGRDQARVESLLWETWAIGERPSRAQFSEYLHSPHRSAWGDEVLGLWTKRLRKPTHVPRSISKETSYPWLYPFAVPEGLVEQNTSIPIGERLVAVLTHTAAEYREAAESNPGGAAAYEARERLYHAVRALEIWGLTRDRAPEVPWGPGIAPPRPTRFWQMLYCTNGGRRRYDQWIERIKRESGRT